ncbi:MAG: hypothetical protein BWX70_02815 [Verrucomicrobia bacterium ADurb.Bin070]|nr:MAG: hypothetical protein BWX70_02815 [Verrucomicrobia bacterium ADurb.Bin070]
MHGKGVEPMHLERPLHRGVPACPIEDRLHGGDVHRLKPAARNQLFACLCVRHGERVNPHRARRRAGLLISGRVQRELTGRGLGGERGMRRFKALPLRRAVHGDVRVAARHPTAVRLQIVDRKKEGVRDVGAVRERDFESFRRQRDRLGVPCAHIALRAVIHHLQGTLPLALHIRHEASALPGIHASPAHAPAVHRRGIVDRDAMFAQHVQIGVQHGATLLRLAHAVVAPHG